VTKTKTAAEAHPQVTLKEQMEELAAIVDRLENPEVSLYEKGMQLVKAASQSLDVAEQRVAVVSESGEVQELDS
jgi:exodeoxyribonuclease VII small subunit